METVDTKIKQSEVSIQRLKDQGVDVSELEEELHQVKAGYNSAYRKVDSDEAAVNGYVEQFYNVESRIIQTERKYQQKKDSSKNDDTVKQAREQVENYGDDDAKAAWSELEESYELAETAEEKGFIANKMSNLGFEAMTTNYGWLKSFFSVVLCKPETKYELLCFCSDAFCVERRCAGRFVRAEMKICHQLPCCIVGRKLK